MHQIEMYNILSNNQAIQYVKFWYEFSLNMPSTFEVITDGATSNTRANLGVGNTIKFYRDGNLVLEGKIVKKKTLQGGGVVIRGIGNEIELMDEKCPVDTGKTQKTYTSTNDNTIFQDLIGNVSGWSSDISGSSATGLDSFRTKETLSVWNAVMKLVKTAGKDININQNTKTVYLEDTKGTSGAFEFTEGKDIGDIGEDQERAKASKVIVYGKGDGEDQITGSAGSGTPVQIVYDKNIISTSEANQRASIILAKIQNSTQYYNFNVSTPHISVDTGDKGKLSSGSIGLDREDVDVVRVRRSIVQGGAEQLTLEVTDPNLREASKNLAEHIAKTNANRDDDGTGMQGTDDILIFSGHINANNSAPLNLTFNLPTDFIQDEAGNFRVRSFTLDYDVDPFRSTIGTASEQDVAPEVLNSSGNTEPGVHGSTADEDANVAGRSGDLTELDELYDTINLNEFCSSGSWETVLSSNVGSGNDDTDLFVTFEVSEQSGGPEDILVRVRADNQTVFQDKYMDMGDESADEIRGSVYIPGGVNSSSDDIELEVYPITGSITVHAQLAFYKMEHDHSDGSYRADDHDHGDGSLETDNHNHPDGSYSAESHKHNVSVGDAVSDAGSINASQVSIYLDHWNGSTWVNKHSILNTGKTLDTDVDLTDGGTYPDAGGYWRVRVYTDSSDPDLVNAIIKCRHQMDT